jgi:hypothetical protein
VKHLILINKFYYIGDRSPRTFIGKMVATGLCIVGVVFWTIPGGIIGSGFALKVEEKNKKKQFNRLVPAAATLIQTWWRMKATLYLSTSNTSCLVATISTFDISKPYYSTSLRRLKKHFDASLHANYDTKFYGLDAPNKNVNNNISNDQQQQINTGDIYVNIMKPNYSNSSSTSQTNDESILLQLSPEHLILIRTILLLKFLAAKQKFKLAFKPYDFKDVIEQYTQGNMEITLKMKDLQRKIEQVSLIANQNSYNYTNYISKINYDGPSYYNGSPITQRSYSPGANTNGFRRVDSSCASFDPNAKLLHEPRERIKRQSSIRQKHYSNTSYENQPVFNSNSNVQSSDDRLIKIETEMSNLSKKIDLLLDISSNNGAKTTKVQS